jgi:hypothetical protein
MPGDDLKMQKDTAWERSKRDPVVLRQQQPEARQQGTQPHLK